jgi:hypothetical protein
MVKVPPLKAFFMQPVSRCYVSPRSKGLELQPSESCHDVVNMSATILYLKQIAMGGELLHAWRPEEHHACHDHNVVLHY